MIIAFVTLLLGLTAGVKTVEVGVADSVASVEVLLDGTAAGTLDGPPWRLDVDLGAELAPHHLVAIARDAGGVELGRAEQWVNLPHEPVEARLLVDAGDRVARLMWNAIGQGEPEQISLSFDGEPLVVEDPAHIALPDHDPRGLHFLRAELRFAGGLEAVAEAAFGGLFGDQVTTEIQALALALDPQARLPEPADLAGWVAEAASPEPVSLAVRALDAGPADVMMVVDLAARAPLEELARSNVVRQPVRAPRRRRADPNLPGYTPQPGPGRRARSRATARVAIPPGLHERDRLRFVYPVARDGEPYRIFPISEPFGLEQGGIFDLLTRVNLPAAGSPQRLADAVAIAGLHSYAGHRRRIVVLVLGDDPVDASRFRLPAVRRYLARLRVPLQVWSVSEPPSDVYRPGREPQPTANAPRLDAARLKAASGQTELGPVVEVASIQQLKAALDALRRQLDRQRIVWVEGHHLPQRVTLTPAAIGARWAGSRN